ncbi:MAG: cell division protein FtsQ [Bacteroides sp.]|nr:hypothetical protein [Roseburia sp.]MCM1346526.1 cell division protein FtsQ [Bacteroides sp.]MCM1420106.1 cell division protein FtsQ [Bacteroides sp.]
MKLMKILRFSFFVILFLGVAAYVIYAMVNMSKTDPEELCTDIVLNIKDSSYASFVDSVKVKDMLKSAKLYPKGLQMKEVDTRGIENELRKNEFIETVECYKSTKGKLCVNVVQRTPVIYILPDNAAGYFIDRTGKIIPNTNYVANIIVATGNLTPDYAVNKILPLGLLMQDEPFWNNQIEQIHVSVTQGNKRRVELVPRVGKQIICLGDIDGFEKKLRRLKIFYEKAMGKVGWNKYDKINLEYNNQIICTKQKK